MSGKISTISARFSKDQVGILERLQKELDMSKTDVLQMALEQLSTRNVMPGANRVELAVSEDALKRAARLHDFYGYALSVEALLSEAVELGLREIRKRLMEDRKEDAELHASTWTRGP
ncbi:MAG: hypothetical protein JW939_08915 [Candidatus Thermoplasmatota archaeon]|nr:hypothetical protein [Candidatus Thermoplasmatota archaeon]